MKYNKNQCKTKKQLTKLKMYVGDNHPHSAQNPKVLDILSLNKKNLIKS